MYGDIPQRIEHYQGNGFYYHFLNIDMGTLQNQIASDFAANGWGIQTFNLSVNYIRSATTLQGGWLDFEIFVDNSSNLSPETIRAALTQILQVYLTDVTLNYVGSNIYSTNPTTGQTNITDAYNDQTPQPQNLSLWEDIFGKGSSPNNTLPSLGSTTLSFTTIAIIAAIGYVLFTSRRK